MSRKMNIRILIKILFPALITAILSISFFNVKDEFVVQRFVNMSRYIIGHKETNWSNITKWLTVTQVEPHRSFFIGKMKSSEPFLDDVKLWQSNNRRAVYVSSSGQDLELHKKIVDMISLRILWKEEGLFKRRSPECTGDCRSYISRRSKHEYFHFTKKDKQLRIIAIFAIFLFLFYFFCLRTNQREAL